MMGTNRVNVFAAGVYCETNMFSPIPTAYDDFVELGDDNIVLPGIVGHYIALADKFGWTLKLGQIKGAEPGGIVTKKAYQKLKQELIEQLQFALPLDAVFLFLHGAMVAKECDDCEGDLIEAVRNCVGNDILIAVTIDPHAHLTRDMSRNSDVLVAYRQWPHTDILESIERTWEAACTALQKRVKPIISVETPNVISLILTTSGAGARINKEIEKLEEEDPRVISISLIHGFHLADVAEVGTRVVVVTLGERDLGKKLARSLSDLVFENCQNLYPAAMTNTQIIKQVKSHRNQSFVVADTSDIPGGGGPGDNVNFLRLLIDEGVEGAALAYVWDPLAVQICERFEVGDRLLLRIGGKSCPQAGDPLDIDAILCSFRKNHRVQDQSGAGVHIGDIAIIRHKGIQIALSQKRIVALNFGHFSSLEMDDKDTSVFVVRSWGNHTAGFESLEPTFLFARGAGVTSLDCRELRYEKIKRPVWPLDAIA